MMSSLVAASSHSAVRAGSRSTQLTRNRRTLQRLRGSNHRKNGVSTDGSRGHAILTRASGDRFDRDRLARESKYPFRTPVLFFSAVLAGKGATDMLATFLKYVSVAKQVGAGIRGASLDPLFLGIDAGCMAVGAGVGYWAWTTMRDEPEPELPAAPELFGLAVSNGAGDTTAGDLSKWVLLAGPRSVIEASLRASPPPEDAVVLPYALKDGPMSLEGLSSAVALEVPDAAKGGWEAYLAVQVAAAKKQGVDISQQALVLLIESGEVTQKRVALGEVGVVWEDLLE